jgi:DNA-binding NarL/FixJ family response regulator
LGTRAGRAGRAIAAYARLVLVGRDDELAVLDGLLDVVRAGGGRALVIRGEPGIGKSALLEHAAERPDEVRVLRATGVEAESELAFALLHQLLGPVLGLVDALPEPQGRALRGAFGLAADAGPDRFLVSVAALTLLSEAAGELPVLCLVDDVQWGDAASLGALMFVARRIEAEPLGVVLAVRDGEGRSIDETGLEVLRLRGLATEAAEMLLDERWQRLDPVVRGRVLRASAGNPLALLELPDAGDGWEPGRMAPLGEPVPLAEELERAFLGRMRAKAPELQRLALLAAADGAGRLADVRRAASELGLDGGLIESEELVDLLRVDGSAVSFRHPLVRSAVYYGAAPAERRAAHRALAAAFAGREADRDRRAWHLALAAEGPDEAVAGELERAAERARTRSGYAAAAAAFERAADLSPDAPQRAGRLVAGAQAAWQAGEPARARLLLERAEELSTRSSAAGLVVQLRGQMELRTGVPGDALQLLLRAARGAVEADPGRALRMLLVAREAAFHAASPEAMAETADIAARLPEPSDRDEALVARVLRAVAARDTGGDAGAVRELIAHADEPADPVMLQALGGMAWGLGDPALGRRLRTRAAARARALGAMGMLAWALEYVVFDELAAGDYASAEMHAEEGRRLAREMGWVNSGCQHTAYLAQVAAWRGRERQARELAREALAEATVRSLVKAAGDANYALGILALSAGQPEEALEHFEALWGSGTAPGSPANAVRAVPDQLEAAARAGREERSGELLSTYLAWVEAVGSRELEALAARCRALLSARDEAEGCFEEALRLHAAGEQPLEHARTQLLYGEWLRRKRRRVDARSHLRAALETFERLGCESWAERARTELRATGETARKRHPSTLDELTAQELQVVRLVAEGLSNRDVAAQLFISPRTVDYHLRKVFRKVGISSRTELIHLALTEPGLSGAEPALTS